MSSLEDETATVAPPCISLDEVYEIGFYDGRRGIPRRETFLLRKWGPEQEPYYSKGYFDGLRETQTLQRPHFLFSSRRVNCLAPNGDRRKVTFH